MLRASRTDSCPSSHDTVNHGKGCKPLLMARQNYVHDSIAWITSVLPFCRFSIQEFAATTTTSEDSRERNTQHPSRAVRTELFASGLKHAAVSEGWSLRIAGRSPTKVNLRQVHPSDSSDSTCTRFRIVPARKHAECNRKFGAKASEPMSGCPVNVAISEMSLVRR
jgi:hypothetical protein